MRTRAHGPAARAPSLPTRESRPLRGRRSSRSLRLLGPLLTLLLVQVDQLVRWATPRTASRRRARRRQRRERREARGGASAVARGSAVGDAVAGRVCAIPAESGGDIGRDRCVRVRLRAMTCEPLRKAVGVHVVVARSVASTMCGVATGGPWAATLASRCVVWGTADPNMMCGLLVACPGSWRAGHVRACAGPRRSSFRSPVRFYFFSNKEA